MKCQQGENIDGYILLFIEENVIQLEMSLTKLEEINNRDYI